MGGWWAAVAAASWPWAVRAALVPASSRPPPLRGVPSVPGESDLRPAGWVRPPELQAGLQQLGGLQEGVCGHHAEAAQTWRSPGQESAEDPLLLPPTSSWSGSHQISRAGPSRSSWRQLHHRVGRRVRRTLAIEEINPSADPEADRFERPRAQWCRRRGRASSSIGRQAFEKGWRLSVSKSLKASACSAASRRSARPHNCHGPSGSLNVSSASPCRSANRGRPLERSRTPPLPRSGWRHQRNGSRRGRLNQPAPAAREHRW